MVVDNEGHEVAEDLDKAEDLYWHILDQFEDDPACKRCYQDLSFDIRGDRVLVIDCLCGTNWKREPEFKGKIPPTSVHITSRRRIERRRDEGTLHLIGQAVTALVDIDKPTPKVFRHGGTLVTVGPDGKLEELTSTRLRVLLADAAQWIIKPSKLGRDGLPLIIRPTNERRGDPPPELVSAILNSPSHWNGIPELDAVVTVPVLQSDGSICTRPGYNWDTKAYYQPAMPDLFLPDVVTKEDVTAALKLILEDLLGDFPFVAESDRANAVAILLQPFVREMIQGPTPLAWIGAPVKGTGKTILASCLLTPGCGDVASSPLADSDAEVRKTITSLLRLGAPAVKWDNVRGRVTSKALESALTDLRWSDRILGSSTHVNVPIRQTWVLTANNATAGGDLARRVVPIRLDAGVEMPYRRSGPKPGRAWRHDLPEWASAHRTELASAALTLCRWWKQEGCPDGPSVIAMGSYGSWQRVLGGILAAAGVNAFCAELAEIDEDDEEQNELASLLVRLHQQFQAQEFTAKQAHEIPDLWEGVPSVNALGMRLGTYKNRIAGGLVLRKRHVENGNIWHLEQVA